MDGGKASTIDDWEDVEDWEDVGTKVAEEAAKKAGSAPGRFMSGISETSNPLNILSLLGSVVTNPKQALIDTVYTIPNLAYNIAGKVREGDIAGAAGMGVGLVGPAATMKLASSPIAGYLGKSASKSYYRALNPTKEVNKYLTESKIVPELLKRQESAFSLEGLSKKAKGKANLSLEALDEAWKNLPDTDSIDTAPMVSVMDDAIKGFQVPGVKRDFLTGATSPATINISPEAVGNLQAIRNTINNLGDKVSPQTLRKVRQVWDKEVARAGGYSGKDLAEGGKVFAREEGANAIRNELAKQFPDIDKINAEFSFWKRVDDVTKATISRRVGQSVPMGEQIATAAGGAGGLSSGIFGAAGGAAMFRLATKVFRSPGWKMVSAIQKMRLAKAFGNGSLPVATQILTDINAGLDEKR